MDTAMTQKELEELLDQAVREVTEQTAGVRLYPGGGVLSEDLFTVHISFQKGFHTSLTLCADTALLVRMAQNALGEDQLSSQDLEDFGKEYFKFCAEKLPPFCSGIPRCLPASASPNSTADAMRRRTTRCNLCSRLPTSTRKAFS